VLKTAFNTPGFEMMYLDTLHSSSSPTLAAVESTSGFTELAFLMPYY
jgi:hypothetical protein